MIVSYIHKVIPGGIYASKTISEGLKSSLEKQLANRQGREDATNKKARHKARKQDGAYYARHDYKTPGGKQRAKCHYIVTMQGTDGR